MIKLVVSDLDGTLLKKDFQLSDVSIQAIKQLQQQKITFLPASGRSYKDITSIFNGHGIVCGAIEVNGAQLRNTQGESLCSYPIDTKMVEQCMQVLDAYGLSLQVFTNDCVYAYPDVEQVRRDMEQVISRNTDMQVNIEKSPRYSHAKCSQAILKLETMSSDELKLAQCHHDLQGYANLAVTSSVPGNLEITNASANKANALLSFLQHMCITKEEVLIFGDSMNDASLFLTFPYTIAVENAHPWIKEHAYAICPSNEEDGVAIWLKEHICV